MGPGARVRQVTIEEEEGEAGRIEDRMEAWGGRIGRDRAEPYLLERNWQNGICN